MPKLVQVRGVPEAVHRTLKSRAALSGRSLSEYLREELRQIAECPAPDELRRRLAEQSAVTVSESPAEMVRALREE